MISLITFGLEEDGNTPSLCIYHIPQAPRKNNYFNRKAQDFTKCEVFPLDITNINSVKDIINVSLIAGLQKD